MFGRAQMIRFARTGGLAIGLLICCMIWLTLRVSGLFRASPVEFPTWVGLIVALGILVTPPVFTFAESLHWIVRLGAGVVFFGCAFAFPWFYDQLTICFWMTMLLVYVEVFCVFPLLLKKRRRKSSHETARSES